MLSPMLIQIIIAMLIVSLIVYGLEMLPMAPVPKRIMMAAVVILTGLTLANRAGLLQ